MVPDLLAGGGAAIAAHAEWAQGVAGVPWDELRLATELRGRLERTFAEVAEFSEEHHSTYRQAAYALAVDRVAAALELRGGF